MKFTKLVIFFFFLFFPSFSLLQRQSLSLLVRLVGTDRARYLKQIEETVSPGDLAEKKEEMEVAMQQV